MARAKALSCGVSAVALGLVGCVTPTEAPPFDPRQVQASERALAQLDISEQLRPMPTTQEDQVTDDQATQASTEAPLEINAGPTTGPSLGTDGEPVVAMSLQQCVQRAVLYNHDVKVAGYQPAIDASRVTEAEALFDPVFFSNISFEHKDDQTAGQSITDPTTLSTGTFFFNRTDTYEGQIGVKDNLISGGQIQADFDTTYNLASPTQSIFNPFYTNKLELQLTQPLLRDFGRDVNEARIYIGRDDARVSLLEFRKKLEEQLDKLEQAYWKLVDDQQKVTVEEMVLKENEDSYQLEASRYTQRLISMQEVSQVETSLEQRRATLIRAKADARNDSDQLKELMNDPNLPVTDPVLIIPSDTPVQQPMQFSIDDQIDAAMENRFELGEDLLKIDTATVTYGVAQNNTLPKLNFIGSVSPDVTQSNFTDALSQESKFGHFEYSLGLQLEMPIGNREALAILRRTALQREQAIEQYAADVAQVSLDVRQAAREVAANYDIVLASRRSRIASERALYDEVERQKNGTEPLTPEYVQLRLDLADRFAQEKEAEDDAVATYNVALEKLEFAKGTLLKYNNVVLQEEPYTDQGLLR
jgi:outer membrane protein